MHLKHRFSRNSQNGCLEDLYNGSMYKANKEFFSCEYNVSFTLNYDGAPKFKSSAFQVWPVQLLINELPPHLRQVRSASHIFQINLIALCMHVRISL